MTKENPALWDFTESDLDIKTAKKAYEELAQKRFIRDGEFGTYMLVNPETKGALAHPKIKERFEGIKTVRFPWFVLDYRRLSKRALKVYAALWSAKNHRLYWTDEEIAFRSGVSERTAREAVSELRQHGMIKSSVLDRAAFARKPVTKRIREILRDERVTRIRQITLCDPDHPGQELRQRSLYYRRIDFAEFREGDVLNLLQQLGVPVLSCDGRAILCSVPGQSHRYCRHVDALTGFSKVDTDKRNRKGKRKQDTESLWQMALKFKGDDGPKIVQRWYERLVVRNRIADPRDAQMLKDYNSLRVPPAVAAVVEDITL